SRHPALAPRRRVLIDCRAVERIDPEPILRFCEDMRGSEDTWTAAIERQAVVVPVGVTGLLIAGVLPFAGVSLPARSTEDLNEAFAFVNHPAAERAHSMADRIVAVTTRRSELLSRLRSLLRL